ncbi:MAG: AI-2E family transporter [Chloroflexi bacterium]|nr:AI-2E family transporter [Chloroflexota bacterium]
MSVTARERLVLRIFAVLAAAWLAIQIATWIWAGVTHFAEVILVFVVAWSLAYLLAPLVARLESRGLGRVGAVGVVYVALAILVAAALAVVVPGLAAQLAGLAERAPEYGDRAGALVRDIQAALSRSGIPVNLEQAYGTLPTRLGELAGVIAGDALGYLTRAAGLLFNVVLVLIIAFLMLIDGDRLWDRFVRALSDELRSEAELFRASADRAFGGFIRSSLIVGVIYGVVTLATLAPLGVPFSGVLAFFAGLAVVIPFFGPLLAMVPIVLITVLGAPDRLVVVLIITAAVQQIMFNVVSPRIMASSIGLHPLLIFAALLVGSRAGGFWGVFLALPIAGIAAVFMRYGYEVARGRRTRTEAVHLISMGERSAT